MSGRRSNIEKAHKDVIAALAVAPQRILTKKDLIQLLSRNRHLWRLSNTYTAEQFISYLISKGTLRVHSLTSQLYQKEITRYSSKRVSELELALSIKARAYASHATAAQIHGLAKFDKKRIYINVEQTPKPNNRNSLNQESINRAFSHTQRSSNLIFENSKTSITILSGKNTAKLAVEEMLVPNSTSIPVTSLERTLIDIVVRPAYSGGPTELLKIYRAAKSRASVPTLLNILHKLDHTYPYHQAIGFLMQHAGFNQADYLQLSMLGLDYDFYLTHAMPHKAYSREWKLFYPQDLAL